jgi:hypothetical protein
LLLATFFAAPAAWAKNQKIYKVLPEFIDLEGRSSLSPSLYERDAYQARLRREPKQRSGMIFFVNWKAKKADAGHLKLRIELRGVLGDVIQRQTLEKTIDKVPWLSTWTTLTLSGQDYKNFGNLIAWRATLLDGDTVLSEQRSFLW